MSLTSYIKVGGDNIIKIIITTIISFINTLFIFLFGNPDKAIKYLITVVILDYISGLCRAIIQKKLNSSIGLKGIFKKIGYFIIVTIALIIGNLLEVGSSIRNITIYSLIINECISILENCSQLGIKFPKILTSSLKIFNEDIESKEINKKTKE
ncbi:MAG TPA: phage holin family protein [Candidatus Coprovivens excrementavium]|nr:phage holin family protein [Candidatus Coprovivens excrementavium]